jgi:16S rRNA (uracil1498-N3)-methyltransferase
MQEQHIFAIHAPYLVLSTHDVGPQIKKINDEDIVHHLIKVLRMRVGESCIVFNLNMHATFTLLEIHKKYIVGTCDDIAQNVTQDREIVCLLPLLKKEALEEAVYSLTEIGVTKIQLVITQKSRKSLMRDKELHRLEKIIIAAAQQSKNYRYPILVEPIDMISVVALTDKTALKVVFDPAGKSVLEVKSGLPKNQEIVFLVGPEAGLTEIELIKLHDAHFISCYLTQTVLRAVQAVALGAAVWKL